MSTLRFHHVGVGTRDLEATVATYRKLGYEVVSHADDEGLSVRVTFLHRAGDPLVEAVAPLGDDHPLKSFIRRGQLPSPYHTGYAVDDLAAATQELEGLGFMLVGEARPAQVFDGAMIQYLVGPGVGLVELVERPPDFIRENRSA